MAGNDHININARERPVSDDINNLQAMGARAVADLERYRNNNVRIRTAGGPQPIEGVLAFGMFVGGITPTGSGANVMTSPGVFIEEAPSISPTPGTLDSTYRLAYQRTSVTTTTPAPGSNTWYLLECRMTEVVTVTESRDILNAISGNFVPTNVTKQLERQLEYQYVTGSATNMPTPTGANGWQPVCGVFRPGGGGAVLPAHIIDLRNFPRPMTNEVFLEGARIAGKVTSRYHEVAWGTTKYFSRFDVDVLMQGNQEAWFHVPSELPYLWAALSTPTIDPTNDPSIAAAGNWFYVYLAPWYGLLPVGQAVNYFNNVAVAEQQIASGILRGVLVESTIAPARQGGCTNGATIHLPAPFNTYAVPAGQAVCIGAFRREGAASIVPSWSDGNKVRLGLHAGTNTGALYAATPGASPVLINTILAAPAQVFPLTAKVMRVHARVKSVVGDGSQSEHKPSLNGSGGANYVFDDSVNSNQDMIWEFDYPLVVPAGAGTVGSLDWYYTQGGGNSFQLVVVTNGYDEALI